MIQITITAKAAPTAKGNERKDETAPSQFSSCGPGTYQSVLVDTVEGTQGSMVDKEEEAESKSETPQQWYKNSEELSDASFPLLRHLRRRWKGGVSLMKYKQTQS